MQMMVRRWHSLRQRHQLRVGGPIGHLPAELVRRALEATLGVEGEVTCPITQSSGPDLKIVEVYAKPK
jgi:hypothetical protein